MFMGMCLSGVGIGTVVILRVLQRIIQEQTQARPEYYVVTAGPVMPGIADLRIEPEIRREFVADITGFDS